MTTVSQRFALAAAGSILLAIAALMINGTGLAADGGKFTAPASTPQTIKDGQAVFAEYCAGCHGRRADGKGPQALNLKPRPQNLRNAPFVKSLSDDRMYTSVSGGVRGTAMPPWELALSPEKRWHAIQYIRSLTADDTLNIPNAPGHQDVAADRKNPVTANDASIASGAKLFGNYCTNCHGPNGDGNGVAAPNLTPIPRNLVVVASWGEKPFIDYLSDARLYASITNGVPGTSMLPWIKVMSDEERWSVINYLRSRANSEREKQPASK